MKAMQSRRLPAVYLIFVTLEVTQLVLFVTVSRITLSAPAVAVMFLLIAGLASGSSLAWGLLVGIHAFSLLAAAGLALSSDSGTLWINLAVLAFTSLALEAVLLSTPMRRHIGRSHHPVA